MHRASADSNACNVPAARISINTLVEEVVELDPPDPPLCIIPFSVLLIPGHINDNWRTAVEISFLVPRRNIYTKLATGGLR